MNRKELLEANLKNINNLITENMNLKALLEHIDGSSDRVPFKLPNDIKKRIKKVLAKEIK